MKKKSTQAHIASSYYLGIGLLFLCWASYASFIEQTLGTAVVLDATAVYFNPAALITIPKTQLITQGTFAKSQFQFTGSAQQLPLGVIESGTATTTTNFSLPSLYISIPINDKFAGGFAVVANDFITDLEGHSILRYAEARNHINDIDLVPAIGIKINECLSIGGNLNLSQAHFVQEPISGLTRLNVPESRSLNNSKGSGLGGDFGILMKLAKKTVLGFNYRSAITYHLYGTSTLNGNEHISSDNYHFNYWTPARSVLSLSHFHNEKIGFIGTLQYLQWDIFKEADIYNFATQSSGTAFINPKAHIKYNFHNSWLLTLGTIYNMSEKWVIRIAGTYNQSPSNGRFQISTGDGLVVGFSMGYQFTKNFTLNYSYGHAFFNKENINIETPQYIITGVNQGVNDAVSLRLTFTA